MHKLSPFRGAIVRPFLALLTAWLAGAVVASMPSTAFAADFPSRTIRLIVGYTPGGSNDIVARIIAPPLGEALGTQVIVENRPGASGALGADHVAKSAPDGYTLLAASASPVVITPHTLRKVPFDTLTDFAPINTVGLTPEAIAIGPRLKVKTLRELLDLAKTQDVSLSSSGNGGLPHLTIELLTQASRGRIVHVPYKGAAPAITDTLAGHVDGIVRAQLMKAAMVPSVMASSDAFRKFVGEEFKRWGQLVKEKNITSTD